MIPTRPLLPIWGDQAWQSASRRPYGQALRRQLQQLETRDLETALPALHDDLYSQVHRDGQRLPFERVYMERRRRLARSAIRLLMDDNGIRRERPRGLWWGQLLEAIEELLAEPSWAWPAHVRHPSGKDAEVIDLFAAETANLCGELVVVFGRWLPPPWIEQMRDRILRGMVQRFLEAPDDEHWSSSTGNWNAVCHQGLLGAALAFDLESDVLERLISISQSHLQRFLSGFSTLGSCLEGITYWEYGFGWFMLLNEQLERWSHGRTSLVHGHEQQLRQIARFGAAMLLSGGQLVPFADSRLDMPPRACLLIQIGKRLDLPECTEAGIDLYQNEIIGGINLDAQRCDLLYLTRMLLESPTVQDRRAPEAVIKQDWIDRQAGLVVVKRVDDQGHTWELAVKAGHNGEPHNHNDCGSFVLVVDGIRVAIELGAPEYTKDTFGPRRYALLATRSSGHSVPMVNGLEQASGSVYQSEIIELITDPGIVKIVLDLSRAYPTQAGHQRLLRTITLDGRLGFLRVEDEAWSAQSLMLESILMTETERIESIELLALPGTALNTLEPLTFKDNQGNTQQVWRRVWGPSDTASSADASSPKGTGFLITRSPTMSAGNPETAAGPEE